jgi:hypothetical protein
MSTGKHMPFAVSRSNLIVSSDTIDHLRSNTFLDIAVMYLVPCGGFYKVSAIAKTAYLRWPPPAMFAVLIDFVSVVKCLPIYC